jgi:hypothetical protein
MQLSDAVGRMADELFQRWAEAAGVAGLPDFRDLGCRTGVRLSAVSGGQM